MDFGLKLTRIAWKASSPKASKLLSLLNIVAEADALVGREYCSCNGLYDFDGFEDSDVLRRRRPRYIWHILLGTTRLLLKQFLCKCVARNPL